MRNIYLGYNLFLKRRILSSLLFCTAFKITAFETILEYHSKNYFLREIFYFAKLLF